MIKYILLTIISVLLIQSVSAVTAGEPYEIFKLPECYGPVTLKIRGEEAIKTGEYNINKFERTGKDRKDDVWEYYCDNQNGEPLNVIIETNSETSNIYDTRIQYYIEPFLEVDEIGDTGLTQSQLQNDNSKRTQTNNNIEFTPRKRLPISWPEFPGGDTGKTIGIVVVVLIVVMFIGTGIYIFYRVFFKSEDKIVSEATLTGNMKDPTDEEIMEYIRNNVK